MLRYPPADSIEEYIPFHVPNSDTRRPEILPSGDQHVMRAIYEERETAFPSLFTKWKRCGGRRERTTETHSPFIDADFCGSINRLTTTVDFFH